MEEKAECIKVRDSEDKRPGEREHVKKVKSEQERK